LDRLAALGVVVTGRLTGFSEANALFDSDLARQVGDADRRMRRALGHIDAYIERTGAAAEPAEPMAPVSLPPGPARVELGGDIRTVLWATGYKRSYPWLEVPVLDGTGELVHREGVTAAPGLFALGLRFQRTRKSHFLGGVGDDAARIAEAIVAGAGATQLRKAA
jgi:putative flavoprotein involved in K+ transport